MERLIDENQKFTLKQLRVTVQKLLAHGFYVKAMAIPDGIENFYGGGYRLFDRFIHRYEHGEEWVKNDSNLTAEQKQFQLGLWWRLDFSDDRYEEKLRRKPNHTKAIACWEKVQNEFEPAKLALAIEALNGRYKTPEEGVQLLKQVHVKMQKDHRRRTSPVWAMVNKLLGVIAFYGKFGVKQSYAKAKSYWESADSNDGFGRISYSVEFECLAAVSSVMHCNKTEMAELIGRLQNVACGHTCNGPIAMNDYPQVLTLSGLICYYSGKQELFAHYERKIMGSLPKLIPKNPFSADLKLILRDYHARQVKRYAA